MRRSLLGLLTLVAVAGLLLVAGCEFFQQDSVLRVASINRGVALRSDVDDWALQPSDDPEEPPYYVFGGALPDSIEVALQYLEIGAGLPTWTPYEAVINKATVTYKSLLDPETVYDPAIIPMTQYVMADHTNKKITKFFVTVVTATWKRTYFSESEPPEIDPDPQDVVEATIKFSGWDSVAVRTVEATGKLTIEFGSFPDGDAFGN
jgi:hypothetical protein